MKSKQIEGFPNYYVTADGDVISYKGIKPRKLKPLKTTQTRKYLSVILYTEDNNGNKIKKQKYIHRLVYEAFVGEIPKKSEIDHIDADTQNNNLSNLQLLSSAENKRKYLKEKYKSGTIKSHRDKIIKLHNEGKMLKEIAEEFGCSIVTIWRIVHSMEVKKEKNGKYIWVPIETR